MSLRHAPSVFLLGLLSAGCPEPEVKADPGILLDENNYTFTGALDVPSFETASGVDVTLDWSALVEDIQCHGLDPAQDIDNVGMVRFGQLTQEEVAAGLSTNNLDMAMMNGYVEVRNDGGTTTNIASMSFFGTAIDVPSEYVSTGGTYLLMLATGTTPGVGARMIGFLAPTETSANTVVNVPTGCGVLEFDVNLSTLTPVPLLAEGPWDLDWSGLEHDGQGNPIDTSGIDSVMLAYFEGAAVADLEANFLDIEIDATELYTVALEGGTHATLADAVDSGGAAFTGFHDGGQWVLALRCSRCYNPAPPFLSLVSY